MAVPIASSAAATSRLTTTAPAVATTSAAAAPATTTAQATTTQAAPVAATTTSTPAAAATTAATSAAAQPAASSSAAANPQPAAQSSSAAPAAAAPVAATSASVSSAARASSSSAAAASSASSASSLAASSSAASSSRASSSSRSASASASVGISGASDSTATTGNNGLSAGAIGGIAGGAAAGVILLVLFFLCWRKKRRTNGEKLPPPPPRDPAIGQTASMMRQRSSSGMLLASANPYRQSSQSGLLQSRPSETGANFSRTPSFYTTYPIATPSSGADISPPMEPQMVPLSDSSGSAMPAETPSSEEGEGLHRPKLAIDTAAALKRDDSSSSNEAGPVAVQPRRIPSIDRLKSQAGVPISSDRPASPSAGIAGAGAAAGAGAFYVASAGASGPSEPGSSRANSPHPSQRGSNYNSPTPSMSGRFPRPLSMTSMSSNSKYMHIGPAGGAPHMGRPVQLKMPTPLGQDASDGINSDFFPSMSRLESGMMAGYDSMRHMNRQSAQHYEGNDFVPEMGAQNHHRMSSSQSLGNQRRSFQPGPSQQQYQHQSLNGQRWSAGPRSPVDISNPATFSPNMPGPPVPPSPRR